MSSLWIGAWVVQTCPMLTLIRPTELEQKQVGLYQLLICTFSSSLKMKSITDNLGDPVEAAAIANVLGSRRPEGDPIYVGSVKTNIGHLEGVSGLAGIIKVVMSLEKGLIAPNINFEFPNESILPDKWNIKVRIRSADVCSSYLANIKQIPRKLEIWKGERLRRASISSFGYGGLNSHAILEQTCDTGSFLATINTSSKRYFHVNGIALPHRYIFTASANDEKAIVRRTSDLIEYLKSKHDKQDVDFLPNLAYTLASRRSNFKWRISVSASNREELIEALLAAKPTRSQALLRLGYVFTGQGSQWYAMGRELLEAYPVFKKSIDKATDILRKFGAAWSLLGK
jgi:acyl transferase domain-containing protein